VAGQRTTLAERRERKGAVEDPQVVLDAALRFLEVRSRSVAEVRRRLMSAGYRPELVEGAIERLLELGMLDDEVFARLWVESRDRARPRGEHALIIELRQKGIDATIITATLKARREVAVRWEDAPAPDGELASSTLISPDEVSARKLLARNARSLARVADPRQRRQRAYALLARNGFDPDVCRVIAATVNDEQGTGESDMEGADET
jgi:SOS response regulatory protein OraA/RecX